MTACGKLIRLPVLLTLLLFAPTMFAKDSGGAAQPAGRRAQAVSVAPPRAEWTVMVFIDGDNNLEEDALIDFTELARVGSTREVNVVVQLDRIGKYVTSSNARFPFWTQTLRFHMKEGITPSPDSTPKTYDIGEANMGDGKTLEDFVAWAWATFPAKRYALIISDHGQGWRGIPAPSAETRTLISGAVGITPSQTRGVGLTPAAAPFRTPIGSPYRTISFDETDRDKLYNREVQEALRRALKGERLELVGFDACLMAMVETAYAVRGVADTFVASEELEPGAGWQYDDWLRALTRSPTMDGQALGKVLIDSYRKRYGTATDGRVPNPKTTLSVTDLTKLDGLADAISALSHSLMCKFDAERQNIKAARDACEVYAPNAFGDGRDYFFHIDLARFCEQLIARTRDREIKDRAEAVLERIKVSVLHNYVGAERRGAFGSNGLAIYFPPSGAGYRDDRLSEGAYVNARTTATGKEAPPFQVEFVERHFWADFLHVYFKNFP